MKKTKTVSYEVDIYHCDVCDKISKPINHCIMCKKHLCNNHFIFDNRDTGDYVDKYCLQCWTIGEKYRERISEIQSRADEEIDDLNQQWKIEALKLDNV